MTQENELYVLHRNGKIDWDSEQVCSNVPGDTLDDSYEWVLFAAAPVVALGGEKGEPPCSEHPDAPHGYNRSASHNAGRYVCDCEGWAAMGGEKGEAVAETENALRPDHPLAKGSCVHGESMAKHCAWCSARPVGKARMLTDLEITRCWEATFGYLELGIAIQHKFCEKNGIEVLS